MENASARNLWGDFLDAHLEYAFVDAPKVLRFYDNEKDANTCLKLISSGTKKATSQSLLGLQLRNERIPKIGDFKIVTDWSGKAKCIIKTTEVKYIPYFNIDEGFTELEGEGDKSLLQWRKTNWERYTNELQPFGRVPRESMIIVCEKFENVFQR